MRKINEECGVFGIYNADEAAKLTYLGLYALQHRGQESTGIVSSDGHKMYSVLKMGLVADAFQSEHFELLPGRNAIGHCRYSTTGETSSRNIQPICVTLSRGDLAIAHNGNLSNAAALREKLEKSGSIFSSTSDSEVIIHLIARSRKKDIVEAVVESLRQVEGAYSLVLMTPDRLIAVRDPHGFRPLSVAEIGNGYAVASESCAFDIINAGYIRSLEPGEIIIIDSKGMHSMKPFEKVSPAQCIFEFIYFSRPDSFVFNKSVEKARRQLGVELAKEYPVRADLVVPVPDSSNCAAAGYAQQSGIPFEMAIIRNHYIGRTFIEPSQSIRDFGAKIKYNPVKDMLNGKKVVLVDDSIVRGTTTRKIIKMLRNAGAREIHCRITAPVITCPCYYGIDTPTRQELIGATHTIEQIRQHLEVDSLGYQTIPGLLRAVEGSACEYCLACFNGEYPVEVRENGKMKMGKQ